MSNEDYEVGYGKPPKANRFKTGNQAVKGRLAKPKDQSIAELIRLAMLTPADVMVNGKRKRMTGIEIAIARLANVAKSGAIKDVIAALKYLQELSPQPLEEYMPPELQITYVMPTMTDPRLKKKEPAD